LEEFLKNILASLMLLSGTLMLQPEMGLNQHIG